ncbi:MAG: UDP-N-acetylmuramate--L-alanine ligase [Proteobacteria bacterium]|nr:UDP-N-acetylmuramate--L-alanine ligase [Pseudomonadota bacterium]
MSFEILRNKYCQKKIHFIGIGGIGMSAIALTLSKIGCQVQGSDMSRGYNIKGLEDQDIKCFIGHEASNIGDDVALVVKTSIIRDSNPEIIAAKERNITIIRRSDMLSMIMREKLGVTIAGTHGKTSTTAMVATLLDVAGLDPLVINGGIINRYGSNARFGDGQFLVAESDESDGSFVDLPTHIGVVTNIEPEHLEFYNGDFSRVKSHYKRYITQVSEEGLMVLCADDGELKDLCSEIRNKKNIVTYGLNKDADLVVSNVRFDVNGATFDVNIKQRQLLLKDVNIPSYGIHNVKNSLAALAIADFLSLDEEIIRKAFNSFEGVKRRFTKVGEVDGVTIIDDYAHHPTEIKATLKAARNLVKDKKVIAVFQPHKYSRVRDLFNEFCESFSDADIVIIDDIYSVQKNKIEGIDQNALVDGVADAGHDEVIKLENKEDLPAIIKKHAKSGDIVMCLGAGDITTMANNLPKALQELSQINSPKAASL